VIEPDFPRVPQLFPSALFSYNFFLYCLLDSSMSSRTLYALLSSCFPPLRLLPFFSSFRAVRLEFESPPFFVGCADRNV